MTSILIAAAGLTTALAVRPLQDHQAGRPPVSVHRDTVRPVDARGASLLQAAIELSPTVARQIAQLSGSDVIVMLQVAGADQQDRAGRTSLISAPKGARYLRVIINDRLPIENAIAMLGHELQHVREIAGAPGIRTEQALANHFRQIGFEIETMTFETALAVEVENQTRKEVVEALRVRKRS